MKALLFFSFFTFSLFSSAQEICNNGIDDDGDLLIDLNDSADCFCSIEKKYEFIPSLIPNPSFEIMDSCPDDYAQVDRCKGWEQATDGTSDFFNMSCPWHGFLNHQPVPDGNGFVACAFLSGWQEYIGSCLTQPLLKGTDYELRFNLAGIATNFIADTNWTHIKFNPVDITLFGTTSCPKFPLSNITPANPNNYFLECPVEKGWKELGKIKYEFDTLWGELTMTLSPTEDIYAVMLGPPCKVDITRSDTSSENGIPYILFDNLVLNKSSVFTASQIIKSTGSFCTNNLQLTAHPEPASKLYQWYQNGVALLGETDTILKISANSYGIGKYTFVLFLDSVLHNCSVSSFVVKNSEFAAINSVFVDDNTICPEHNATFGSTNSSGSSCKWFFGDGDSSMVCNPNHAYKKSGSYNVKLSIATSLGCIHRHHDNHNDYRF